MTRETVIRLDGISKCYRSYERDLDRLLEVVTGKPRHHAYYALHEMSLEVARGEVIGLVGKNGAGKSTLLKMLASTLQPSTGKLMINGRVSAILELGASFHPEMTGHDNVYLTCAIQGLSRAEAAQAYDAIVDFAGIGEFIDRPVKTYSSGMVMRLAFAIATHVNPDILIIDEALSVGDGVFARRSFDRIMEFRKAGKTIFFCSHSLYQVEALCDRVLWLDQGNVRSQGEPAKVITEYGEFLRMESAQRENMESQVSEESAATPQPQAQATAVPRILEVAVRVDGQLGRVHRVQSSKSTMHVQVRFQGVRGLPVPSVGIAFTGGDGRILASLGTKNDGYDLKLDEKLEGRVEVTFPDFPLLKGNYNLDVYLMCEQGLLTYEAVRQAAELNVEQAGLARGIVNLPHQWKLESRGSE